MSRICVGIVTKPQALKGQFRLKPNLLNLKSYKKIIKLEIDNIEYDVESVSLRESFVIIKLKNIDTCEQAEKLRNKEVFADVEEKFETHFDLLNFVVIIDNKQVGKVIDINNYGSKDVVSVKGNKSFMLPIIDNLIEKVDEDNKSLYFNKVIFEQVVVYED